MHQFFSERGKNKRFSSIKQYICDNFYRMLQPRKMRLTTYKRT